MNYEKKLKEALVDENTDYEVVKWIEQTFPELKESEDERIRKELVEFVRNRGGFKQEWISWLEKQGKKKSIWHNEDEEPQRGSLILLIMQSGNPIVAKIIEPNHTFNHGERWAYIDELLEKQGEQKPADKVEPKFKVGDWIVNNEYNNVAKVLEINNEQYRLDYGDTVGTISIALIDNDYHLWTQ